jgi:nitroimidazol reductase NimA-like FMN-containing flavoprotein (pyridoxamine 5'-phosphate oxidase superfamily)
VSEAPQLRRTDKLMSEARVGETLAQGYAGRVSTVGADGWPYTVPLLYVLMQSEIWVHNASARGHFRTNVEHDSRVCFEIDEPGEIFAYGRFECDTSVAYRSVIVFGRIRVIEDKAQKAAFFDAFMTKYRARGDDRPASFFPRLDAVTVYAIAIDRLTGKETPLPAPDARWPAADFTKSPHAKP